MKDHYDFSDAVKNPYAKEAKVKTTIRIDKDTILYFKELADKKEIPYQTLINLFLKYCAENKWEPKIEWKKDA